MKLKILSWNARGANDSDKRLIIKSFLNSKKAKLVCLQETKIQKLDPGLVRSLGGGRFSQWGAVDALGAKGEILLFWDKRVLKITNMVIGQFFVSCQFRNWEDGFL